ncbi:MFS general substrate transporter [Meredithblackwellia eburnea MCA 4105]
MSSAPTTSAVPTAPTPRREGITSSEHSSTETLDENRDVERVGGGEKGSSPSKVEAPMPAPPHQEKDEFLVTLEGRDPQLNPHNWKESYRWFLTALGGLLVLNATFASSAPSNLIPSIIKHYNVSEEVGVLLISIFVAGYCLGPILWGPLSERYGRRKIFIIAFIPYVGFQIGCALAKNVGSQIIFRFLGGCFASAPLTASGGLIADLWGPDKRGDALAIFSLMPFAGPAIAPIVSGYMEVTGTDFRWIFWTLAIFAGVCLVAIVALLPETFVPYLLYQEAKRVRKETGDERFHAALEKKNETMRDVLNRTVLKPFIMIAEEPLLLVVTVYMSFVYGLIYLMFEAVPIIFVQGHGLNAGEAGLVFLALLSGGVIGVVTYIFYFNKKYTRKLVASKPKPVAPEERLEPMLWAAPFLAISFFWIGWTSYPSISIASPILAIVMLGAAVLFIFLSCFNILIDTYLWNAASALAINTVCRSAFGAAFPLFATQMYNKLGTPGASSLLGGLAIVFIPAPFLMKKYGKKIRMMSKNAVVLDKD